MNRAWLPASLSSQIQYHQNLIIQSCQFTTSSILCFKENDWSTYFKVNNRNSIERSKCSIRMQKELISLTCLSRRSDDGWLKYQNIVNGINLEQSQIIYDQIKMGGGNDIAKPYCRATIVWDNGLPHYHVRKWQSDDHRRWTGPLRWERAWVLHRRIFYLPRLAIVSTATYIGGLSAARVNGNHSGCMSQGGWISERLMR